MPGSQPGFQPNVVPKPVSKPDVVVPPKSVNSRSIDEPNIDSEINDLCNQLSIDELQLVGNNRDELIQRYYTLNSVQGPKKQIDDYVEFIKQRANEVLMSKNTLKEEASKYDQYLMEYENIKKSITELMNQMNKSNSSESNGGVKPILDKKIKNLDAGIKQIRDEFKKQEGTKSNDDVLDFMKKYYKSMCEYNRLSSLMAHSLSPDFIRLYITAWK